MARSRDLSGFGAFAFAAGATLLLLGGIARGLAGFTRATFAAASGEHPRGATALLESGAVAWADAVWPVLLAAFAGAFLFTAPQVGALFTLQPIKPQLRRIELFQGLGQIFSGRRFVDLLKTLAAILAVGAIIGLTFEQALGPVLGLTGATPQALAGQIAHFAELLALRGGLLLLVVGGADLWLQRHRQREDLMMTRYEVKRERREAEGDPQRKAERRRLHRQAAQHDMVEAVGQADYVVAHPDQVAIALRYDPARDPAPRVIARGRRLIAQRIKEVARHSGVPIFHDAPLARALVDLPLGAAVPERLYPRAAELLRLARI